MPINKTHYGYVFFTRPQLNMQTNNIKHVRNLLPLLTTQDKSIHRAIRCYLD
ncbi:hypothetical protein ACXWOC_11260, partial [Streptococcus pyogenes]